MALDNHKAFINESLSKVIEPILTNAELEIKLLIRNYLLNRWDKNEMAINIDRLIARAMNKLPTDTPNKEELFMGMKRSSIVWYNTIRNQINPILIKLGIYTGQKQVNGKYITLVMNKIEPKGDKLVLKSYPEVMPGYNEKLVEELLRLNYILKEMASYGLQTDYVAQQTPISLFAKLEMANRYNNNMGQLRDKLESGEDVVRFSQHRDCSKRCESWQGKAVHLMAQAINDKFETGLRLPTGETIYSYQGITSQLDKYGWRNNIHTGFNCRHYLKNINDTKPDPYDAGTIKAARKANHTLRNMERAIRNLRKQYHLFIGDRARRLARLKIDEEVARYYQFAKDNKVVPYGWRLEV